MKRLWKKLVVKVSAAAVIVVALALLGLCVWFLRAPAITSFDFLKGRDITAGKRDVLYGSDHRVTLYVCILAADFNDICLSAHAELMRLGYRPPTFTGPTQRNYIKHGRYGESVSVLIREKRGHLVYSTPDSSDYPRFCDDGHDCNERWVNILISQKRLRLWPPRNLLYALKMRFNSVRQKP